MATSSNLLVNLSGDMVKKRFDETNNKVYGRKPESPLDEYNQIILAEDDWLIREQPVKKLPISLTFHISLALRDEGNSLIERTRSLNNQYIGEYYKEFSANLVADLDVIELQQQILTWGEEVTKALLYKFRRQGAQDPIELYHKLYRSIVTYIDQKLAHGMDHMYAAVWDAVCDAIPYWLLDGLFLSPGLIEIQYEDNEDKSSFCKKNIPISREDMNVLLQHFNLYGVEANSYTKNILLDPLAEYLLVNKSVCPSINVQWQVNLIMGDLLEALPYMLSSKRAERLIFDIPGTTCCATFLFLSENGLGRFVICNSKESLIEGLSRSFYRSILNVDFFGQISAPMHPWQTLDRMFGKENGLLLTYWFLKQIHARVVEDYLKIKTYYLHEGRSDAPTLEEEDVEMAAYMAEHSWTDHVQPEEEASDCQVELVEKAEAGPEEGLLPQMRRSRFFKLLGQCGVRVEQGKGSEIKLLKGTSA